MKKTFKKACSIALVLTTTTGVVGANLSGIFNSPSEHVATYAENAAVSDGVLLQIAGSKSSAIVGSEFTIPAASLNNNGTITSVDSSDITVYGPLGENVTVSGGKFKLDRTGEYSIVYSVKDANDVVYSGTYNVVSTLAKSTVVITENTSRILPKKVWKSYEGKLYIPKAELEFPDDEKAIEYDMSVTISTPNPSAPSLDYNKETGEINYTNLEVGTYSVRYTAYSKSGVYLNSKTIEFEVFEDINYIKNYDLQFDFKTTPPTAASIGDTIKLPAAVGKRITTVAGKTSSEEVPVYYTIDAYILENGKLVNVTDRTFKDKKVIDGNEFTAPQKGHYYFYYNVADALGKKAERTGFEIDEISDLKAPAIKVVDGYSVDNTADLQDVTHKLQQNFENGKNIVIKAIYAEDLAEDFADLTLFRVIRSENQSSSSEYIYSEEKEESKKQNFNKDLIFNKTADFAFDENTMIDAGTLEEGSYTVYYHVKDKSGNKDSIPFTFSVNNSFEFTKAPTVKFNETFTKTIKTGDVITFTLPTANDENDDYLLTTVMYRYNNDVSEGNPVWKTITANDEGKFIITADKEGATELIIRAKTENDAPLTSLEEDADADIEGYTGIKYAYEEVVFKISNNQDSEAPELRNLGAFETDYNQNSTIDIPAITFEDDLVDSLNVWVEVTHLESGNTPTIDGNAVTVRSGRTYTLSGLNFHANLDGEYQIVYKAKDAGNNQILIFKNITVKSKIVNTEPKFANLPETLKGSALELGESIELPVPELEHSSEVEAKYEVSIRGNINHSLIGKETFTPKAVGTYTVIYTMYTKEVGGDFEIAKDSNDNEVVKEFKVEVVDTTKPEVRVVWNLKESYNKGDQVLIPVFEAYDLSKINFTKSKITISSKSYTRTIEGTKLAEQLELYEKYVKDPEANPNPGLLYMTLNYEEVYTVTYTVMDSTDKGNPADVVYSFRVGDTVAPILTANDGVLKVNGKNVTSSVKLDSLLSIDLSKLSATDNKTSIDAEYIKNNIIIEVLNKDTNVKIDNKHKDENNGKYEYDIVSAGTYEVSFIVKDNAGNKSPAVVRTFKVDEKSASAVTSSEVIGTVLIVVSVLVLAGVIVYFVVSKKKVDKMYK